MTLLRFWGSRTGTGKGSLATLRGFLGPVRRTALIPRSRLLSRGKEFAGDVEKGEICVAFWKHGARNVGGRCDILGDCNTRMSAGRTTVEVGILRGVDRFF